MAHAKESLINAANCLPDGVEPVGTFICQGKVDPKVIEMMYKMFPKGHSHGQSADRDARHKQAAVHPNEDDFKAAALTEEDGALLGHIFAVIAKLAKEQGLENGYRVISNVGEDAGQTVKHLHFHVLGGEKLPV